MEVSAGSQKPALVMRQTVAHKQHIVFLARLTERLSQLCLLVFDWSQYKGRGVNLDWARPLQTKIKFRIIREPSNLIFLASPEH